MDQPQSGSPDRDAGLNPAGKAGRGRQIGDFVETELTRQRPHAELVDAGFDIGMPYAMLASGVQTRPVFAQIVEIGPREDLGLGLTADCAIQVDLAEKATVDRV